MLKTRRGSEFWLITQPAHGALSGEMAAHWGNDTFARPGAYAPSPDAGRLRDEVVLAIAEHDNGWWEWEAAPPLSPEDGLPQGLGEVTGSATEGMQRWRLGVPRLAEDHPYASVLIGDHAYWLYATQFEPDPFPAFTHPLQRGRVFYPDELGGEARRFLSQIRAMQESFSARLRDDELWRDALEPAHRFPHTRLLQVLDAFSLAMCSNVIAPVEGAPQGLGRDHVVLEDVPRASWDDRVSLDIRPRGDDRIVVDPYPFDTSPLTLSVVARVAEPHSPWRRAPLKIVAFTCVAP